MRVYWKVPSKEVRIVRPNNEGDTYEVYVLTPVCIGTIEKTGSQRAVVNGIPYTNLNTATRVLLEQASEDKLASGVNTRVRGNDTVTVTGLDMIKNNVWNKFCEARQIDPGSIEHLKKTYALTPRELAGLGLPLKATGLGKD